MVRGPYLLDSLESLSARLREEASCLINFFSYRMARMVPIAH